MAMTFFWLVNAAFYSFARYLQPFWHCLFYKIQSQLRKAKLVPLTPSLPHAEQTKFPWPLTVQHVLQLLCVLVVCLQTYYSVLVFLLSVLHLGSQNCCIQGRHHFSWAAGYTSTNLAQYAALLQGCTAAHIQPVCYQHLQLFLFKS